MIITEAPGEPQNLSLLLVRKHHVTLSWSPPFFDGGSPILLYVAELRDKLSTT